MILFEEALQIVLSRDTGLKTERIHFTEALNRVLAEDILADLDMPPFDKSAVDGYAFSLSSSETNPGSLELIETIAAGATPEKPVYPGQCSKIMTGAMVPPGADCVVMVEDTEVVNDVHIRINRNPKTRNICYRGEDIRSGELVLARGTRLTAAHIAVLASLGAVNPLVASLPRIGIISTGNELVEPEHKPGSAQIRNSNAWQLRAQTLSLPAIPNYYGIATDDEQTLQRIINQALNENDVVLLTGGVSMGDFDFVPAILAQAGVEILFKSIAIQPGRPTVFGQRGSVFVFGLPGNPVSSFVLFEMMVRPFICRMMGNHEAAMVWKLPMGADYARRNASRKSMIPVVIRDGFVFPVEYHGSAHINACTLASGLMVMEIGTTVCRKGEIVDVRPL